MCSIVLTLLAWIELWICLSSFGFQFSCKVYESSACGGRWQCLFPWLSFTLSWLSVCHDNSSLTWFILLTKFFERVLLLSVFFLHWIPEFYIAIISLVVFSCFFLRLNFWMFAGSICWSTGAMSSENCNRLSSLVQDSSHHARRDIWFFVLFWKLRQLFRVWRYACSSAEMGGYGKVHRKDR